jgi:hypothetical protein
MDTTNDRTQQNNHSPENMMQTDMLKTNHTMIKTELNYCMPQETCKRPQQKHKEAHEDEPKGSKQVGHSVTNCNKY